jgi:hypothetical protein
VVKTTGFCNGQIKRKILGCIFSEKLVFEKGRVATTPFTEPIQVLSKINKVLQESKNKKEVENNLLSTFAPQVTPLFKKKAGELTTHGLIPLFGNKKRDCSNHCSLLSLFV